MGDGEVNGEPGEVNGGVVAERCERREGSAKCPECGSAQSERTPAVPWLVRHRLTTKCAALLLVLGFVVIQNVRTWPVMMVPTAVGPEEVFFPAHRYTRADLQKYASGAIDDGQLLDDLIDDLTLGSYQLEVALVEPEGESFSVRSHGWPGGVATYLWTHHKNDVYAKYGARVSASGRGSGWSGLTYHANRIDEMGRLENFEFRVRQLALPLFLVMAALSLGWMLRFVLVALDAGDCKGFRARDRWLRRTPALCAALFTIVIIALSFPSGSVQDNIYPTSTPQTLIKTKHSGNELASFAKEPGGEAVIAAAILETVGPGVYNPDRVLAIRHSLEEKAMGSYAFGGWPGGYFYSTFEKVTWPTTDAAKDRQIRFKRYGSTVVVTSQWGQPLERRASLELSLVNVALIGFMLYGAWWAVPFAGRLAHWWVRRRAVKRVAAGQCVRCGYDLKGN